MTLHRAKIMGRRPKAIHTERACHQVLQLLHKQPTGESGRNKKGKKGRKRGRIDDVYECVLTAGGQSLRPCLM